MSSNDYLVRGGNLLALFTLAVHRGDGMCLLAMDWIGGEPPADFVGFAIEFRPPGFDRYFAVNNRLCFEGKERKVAAGEPEAQYPSTEAPFQTFRWVHFPRDADKSALFHYRVTPIFMGEQDALSRGEPQDVDFPLQRETYPGQLDIAFTRGFVSSQAFSDKFGGVDGLTQLVPGDADEGLDFVSTHPDAARAYDWMGFDARARILELIRAAIDDGAEVRVVAYELNLPELMAQFEKLGSKLRIIIDDSSNLTIKNGVVKGKDKAAPTSAESMAAVRLTAAGCVVKRQHMFGLQHNKSIVVDGPTVQAAVCGSTNFSWRGFYVQANNALIMRGPEVVTIQLQAFEAYWNDAATFRTDKVSVWRTLPLADIDGQIAMSPRSSAHKLLPAIGADIRTAHSSLFYSLAFLNQTGGDVSEAVKALTLDPAVFAFGISDKKTGIAVIDPSGNASPVYSSALTGHLPEPFRSESSGGSGVKMHHKFVVIDFDKPSARVYTGSFNFSKPADTDNGENLLLFRDKRIATSYMVEAVRLFDHYRFRVKQTEMKAAAKADPSKPKRMSLKRPPKTGETAWYKPFYSELLKIRDRKLFGG
jgi:phosphatidylserine/phosphatidylglycerophosphate/cardiolipin synthase-like enzyme